MTEAVGSVTVSAAHVTQRAGHHGGMPPITSLSPLRALLRRLAAPLRPSSRSLHRAAAEREHTARTVDWEHVIAEHAARARETRRLLDACRALEAERYVLHLPTYVGAPR